MARFDKLEINTPSASPRSTQEQVPRNDELSCLDQAVEQRRSGHYENALRLYSRALEDDRSLVAGWLGQVQMLILLDESVEAELWSRKALELFPGNGDLMAGRAQALVRMGDVQQAHVLTDGSLKQAGQSAYRWMVRGELMVVGRQETDRHCFDKAVQIDRDWLVPLEIALVYLHHGLPNKALDRARQAVELAPDRYHTWFLQGQVQGKLGLEPAAKKSWHHCLELCPRHVDANRELAALEQGGWSLGRLYRRLVGRS